ncbi:unnamed protein product [Adineta ricciae]|uniref:Uncharacterized protein n=1 Tax=Adineta ricciae TaxID=249248 RepID=A0A814JVE4_ADIRI|nr:unnamed protein product [Adineta ricciae]
MSIEVFLRRLTVDNIQMEDLNKNEPKAQDLTMLDIFSSLVNVDRRFHRLAIDPHYVRHFDLTDTMIIQSLCNRSSSIDIQFLPRFSEQILPRIHHHIHQLTVEQSSIKSFLTVNYPQLNSLSLVNFEEEILYQCFTDDLVLRDLTERVTNLNVDIKKPIEKFSKTVPKIFASIISLCKGLTDLNFCYMFPTGQCELFIYAIPRKSNISSSLTTLKINVKTFIDCVYILDGRFECLSTFIVKVKEIFDIQLDIRGGKPLPKLKCFSFISFDMTCEYDDLIVPLLRRMINLEELQLYLVVVRKELCCVDGFDLWYQFLDRMTQLKKFTFNIHTTVWARWPQTIIPSNEDIQRSFHGRNYPPVVSCITKRPKLFDHECHIYSLPYDFEYYSDLNNRFQGGMFSKVRQLKMRDNVPFEYSLFEVVARDFPFLQFLYISNTNPMKDKEYSCALIAFPYLTLLNLHEANVDYAELFLSQTKMHLPCLLNLSLELNQLTSITNHFTEDPTHFNLKTLKSIDVCESFVRPENFHQYCPLL